MDNKFSPNTTAIQHPIKTANNVQTNQAKNK